MNDRLTTEEQSASRALCRGKTNGVREEYRRNSGKHPRGCRRDARVFNSQLCSAPGACKQCCGFCEAHETTRKPASTVGFNTDRGATHTFVAHPLRIDTF